MEVIYSLIPAMIFLGLAMVVVLVWAIRRGQYEDLEGDAHRILHDDDDPNLPAEMKAKKAKASHSDQRMPDADDD
ncbi:MAG: cbb3-type cytochrome oxidase assembly protein CcoS [Gammaproteobacteria bacterium HGW-Gammaproteobacteria-1]|jgi:cbb3-type cytochrome oxidase maturation protein|nr:MAG: cbb3-type cytochrome oxidase assembly protein CcoS [Gammaproteobacteria bacterium HGW-Gammaproteobacteria-1]